MPVQQRVTASEFLALPEKDDAAIRELVAGEVIVNEPTLLHNLVSVNLVRALDGWVTAGEGRGRVVIPLDVKLDEINVFAPDVSWYSAARPLDPRLPPPYPLPDLAVEIRSPSTWRYDVGAKKGAYERHGLPELWLVDVTAEEVLVFRRSARDATSFDVALELGRGETLGSPLLRGFEVAIEDLFEGARS